MLFVGVVAALVALNGSARASRRNICDPDQPDGVVIVRDSHYASAGGRGGSGDPDGPGILRPWSWGAVVHWSWVIAGMGDPDTPASLHTGKWPSNGRQGRR